MVRLAAQRLEHLTHKADNALREQLTRARNRYEKLGGALDYLSPLKVLGRGYALVQDAQGHVIASASQTKPGMAVKLHFHDGSKGATVDKS